MPWYQWYPTVLRKYVVFDGRSGRPEFWWFQLANLIVVVVIAIISDAAGASNLLPDLYWLAVLLPSLAVSIRRMHDTDRSGWWVLINLIPLVGGILFIVWAASSGTFGPNRFGSPPDGGTAAPATAFDGQAYQSQYQTPPPPTDPQAAPPAAEGSPRYCARCGSPLTPGATYCGNCGAPVA
jgi:uncharacterized membrane protein YhaH (DUF805 family)